MFTEFETHYCFSIISGGEFQELQNNRVLNMETDGRNCSFATGIC